MKDLKWVETNISRCRHFATIGNPIALHLIQSGFKDEYVMVEEYGEYESYEMYILTGAEVKKNYGIIV